jgi:hypothetical protein
MGQKMMQGVDVQAWLGQMRNSNAGMAQLLGGKPGASDAMTQMAKEMAKLKGTRVLEVFSMGGVVPAGSGSAQSNQPKPGGTSTGDSTAGQVAGDTAAQTAANESSRMGSFGSALGGSMMSAWHKKKAKVNSDSDTTSNSATSPAGSSAATGGAQGTQNVVLMSMTTEKTNFSHDSVPASAFEVPAGYMKMESPMVP